MTLEKADDLTVEQLHEVRDRPLDEAYETHDIGHTYLTAKLKRHGFVVEDHGDDARHADEVFYGEGPDIAIYDSEDDSDPVAYIEIKVKTDPAWFGRCNLRHFGEYCSFSGEVDVPVFIWFALVDEDDEQIHREAFVEVDADSDPHKEITDLSDGEVVFHEADVVEIDGDNDLQSVDGRDVVGVRRDERIVSMIPDVHGNDVVCLNDDDFRSWPHILWRLE